jgi:tetratricopeptide (TPR) repeat protein
MRLVALAVLIVPLTAASASAQFMPPFGPPPGGLIVYPGRYVRVGFGYPWPGTTIIVNPPLVTDPGAANRLANVLNRIPQVPPADERELWAAFPRPARALPAEPIPKMAARAPLLAPAPAANKLDESERQIRLGRDAFAAGQIGQAAERFRQAIALAPDRPEDRFLLAQAEFALAHYREAVVAILEGLKLNPDWPAEPFDPRDLYNRNVIDHALDLERLRQAAERNPDEPALAFLYGYQLWFNGRREEARPYLERALKTAADPGPIRAFLDRR